MLVPGAVPGATVAPPPRLIDPATVPNPATVWAGATVNPAGTDPTSNVAPVATDTNDELASDALLPRASVPPFTFVPSV